MRVMYYNHTEKNLGVRSDDQKKSERKIFIDQCSISRQNDRIRKITILQPPK